MSDPLRDAAAGFPSPFLNNLSTVNGVLEAARDWRRRRLGELGGQTVNDPRFPAAYCRVRNDTGGDLDAGAVLALGTPVISAVDYPHAVNRTPLFPGTAPAAATDNVVVLVEPVAYNQIGLAAVIGLAVCDLSVTDEAHTAAVPAASVTATLASAETGPASIIWKEAGTGTKRAVVLIGRDTAAGGAAEFFARLTEADEGKWKWVAITLGLNGSDQLVWEDDGDESADYTAVPLLTANDVDVAGANAYPVAAPPYAGMRVRMHPSKYAGLYEFAPIVQDFTPFLAVLTGYHSQNRWNFKRARCITSPAEGGHDPFGDEVTGGLAYGVAFPPDSPYARFSAVNNVQEGQAVLMWASARVPGTYEFLPQQFAGAGSDGLVSVGKQIIPGYKVMPSLFISNGFGSGPGGNIIHFTWGDDPEADPNWALIRTTSPASENPYPTGLELLATNFNLPEGWRVEPTVDKTFAIGVDGDRGVYVQTPNLLGVGPSPKGFSHDPASAASGVGLVSALCPYGIPLPVMQYGWGGSSGPWFQEAGPNTIYAKHGFAGTCFYRDALNVEHDMLAGPSEIDGGGP